MTTPHDSPMLSGIPVDRSGGPTVDPTKNVLDLVHAANQRQDDLREEIVRRLDIKIASVETVMSVHDKRYEERFEAMEKAVEAALASADRAVSKAEAATEKRFEGVNEFRAQLGDQQRTLMPRTEAEQRLQTLADEINILKGFRTEVLQRGIGKQEGWQSAVGIIGAVLATLSLVSVALLLLRQMAAP